MVTTGTIGLLLVDYRLFFVRLLVDTASPKRRAPCYPSSAKSHRHSQLSYRFRHMAQELPWQLLH